MYMKKGVLIYISIFSLILFSFSVSAAVLNVPGDHSSIQAAINNASDGDTILAGDGTYSEQLIINKNNLNISSVNGASFSVINLKQPSETTGIWITANNTIFNGFTVMNISTTSSHAQYAIRVRGSGNTISNNIIIGQSSRDWWSDEEDSAINLDGTSATITSNNIIRNNEIYDFSAMGVQVVGSGNYNAHDNIIRNNNIHDIQYYAIANDRSANQTITNNSLSNIGPSGHLADDVPAIGIIVWGSNSNGTNIIYQSLDGIEVGIALSAAREIIIKNSEIKNNNVGIRLSKSSWLTGKVENNKILNNIIINNDYGILISSGNSSQIGKNKINYNLISGNIIGLNSSADNNINATYNNWGACNGPSGIGSGSGDSVYGNVSYIPWLGACIENKTQPNCIIASDNVTLRANVTSNVCVGNVWFGVKIGGVWNNYTYTSKIGNTYSYIIPFSLLIGGQNVSWTVYADDCYNHTMQNGIVSFYVNRRTNLSASPLSPDGLNNWYVTEPLFILTNPDANKIWYRWDSTPNILYTSPFNLTDIPNPPPVSAGTLGLTWWGNLTCRLEPEQSKLFYIDLTNPRFTDLTPGNNSIVVNNNKPIISAYIDEVWGSNSGINKSKVIMKLDGNVVQVNVTSADELDVIVQYKVPNEFPLSEGMHIVYINVTDNSGRYSETGWAFNVTTTAAFSLNIISPENKTYGEKKIRFDLYVDNEIEKIEYIDYTDRISRWKKLCSSCDSYNKTRSLRDGSHVLSFKAIDYYGASEIKNITFLIDSIKPKIKTIEPKSNSFANGENFSIKYTEENLKEIILFYGNDTQTENKILDNCASGENQVCETDADLSNYNGQEIGYWFVISDFIRNESSRKNKINVDTTAPIMVVLSPQEGGSYGNKVPFRINVSEKVELRYLNDSSRSKLLCRNCASYSKDKIFDDGNYSITIKVEDKAGNVDEQSISFTVS